MHKAYVNLISNEYFKKPSRGNFPKNCIRHAEYELTCSTFLFISKTFWPILAKLSEKNYKCYIVFIDFNSNLFIEKPNCCISFKLTSD